jgi:hypothetical protein
MGTRRQIYDVRTVKYEVSDSVFVELVALLVRHHSQTNADEHRWYDEDEDAAPQIMNEA